MNSLLAISNINKNYPGVQALKDVTFDIKAGEVHALVGENGAGKSTLIKILAGVIKADSGKIFVEGKEKEINDPLSAMKLGIAVTYQELSLFPNLTVAENIVIENNLEKSKKIVNWRFIKKKAQETLDKLGVDIDINIRLRYLSIGNQNLIAIARAIVHSAKILILDEPTASLASKEVSALFNIIHILQAQGMGILFVSHRLDEVFNISDRTTILRDGKNVGCHITKELKEEQLISKMVGRKIHFKHYNFREGRESILKVHKLTKANNFQDISFELRKGEILGITGLVGSGRTEVAQAIFGNNIPDSGDIYLKGKKISVTTTKKSMNNGIAYIPESRLTQGLILDKTMVENIAITTLEKLTGKFNIINQKKQHAMSKDWISKLNIKPPYPYMKIDNFSGGNQQKVVIAKWLSYKPDLLIVDEPTHGIDIVAKNEIQKLLRELSDTGIGVIMISSELPEIMAISDRILVMRRGRIAGEFKNFDASQEKIMNIALKGKKDEYSEYL